MVQKSKLCHFVRILHSSDTLHTSIVYSILHWFPFFLPFLNFMPKSSSPFAALVPSILTLASFVPYGPMVQTLGGTLFCSHMPFFSFSQKYPVFALFWWFSIVKSVIFKKSLVFTLFTMKNTQNTSKNTLFSICCLFNILYISDYPWKFGLLDHSYIQFNPKELNTYSFGVSRNQSEEIMIFLIQGGERMNPLIISQSKRTLKKLFVNIGIQTNDYRHMKQLQILIEMDDDDNLKWFSIWKDGKRTRIYGNQWSGLMGALAHLVECACAVTNGECMIWTAFPFKKYSKSQIKRHMSVNSADRLKQLEQSLAQNSDWNSIDAHVRTTVLNKHIEDFAHDVLKSQLQEISKGEKKSRASRKKKDDNGSSSA